jgi:ABC-2 type transport system ATP-binding protein
MNTHSIEIQSVHHAYEKKPVLQDLNLRIKTGTIYGFLGRNGAGKSTLIRMLAGLIKPRKGTVRVLGLDPFSLSSSKRQSIGYLSERQILPPVMSVHGVLMFCSRLYPKWNRALAEKLLHQFELNPKQKVDSLSLGSARMLGFILAVAPEPDVLILDEPAANLDVVARREFLDQILSLIRQEGKTVFFSTHILGDIERVADEVGILAHGKLQINEPLDTLKDSVKKARFYGFQTGRPCFDLPGAYRVETHPNEMIATLRIQDAAELSTLATKHHCQVETIGLNLEDLFVELARN